LANGLVLRQEITALRIRSFLLAKMDNTNQISKIKEIFQPLYEQELTEEEAFDIGLNLTSFFELLIKIEQQIESNREKSN